MKFAFFSALIVSSFLTHAYTSPVEQYIAQAQHHQLDKNKTWQRLMYAHQAKSEVSYSGFFFSANGADNLQDELNANIRELFIDRGQDQSIICRFPARSAWLIEQLKIKQEELPKAGCPALEEWIGQIKPYQATLIYATDFMGNPSSMFGHTLLRLDPKDQKELNLISYAVNYAATVENSDSFSFAWKGLTGQYPGEYSLMPYYRKVKEYGDFESRDLWEYELALNPEETTRLVQHIWELKHVQFPYYFISDNCAYRLLGLIDLVKPDANLQAQFSHIAIPVETIKAVQQQGLIKDTVYRPALETQLLHQAKQHGNDLAHSAHQLTLVQPAQMREFLAQFTAKDQARILEMAYDHLYLQLISQKIEASIAQPKIRQILSLRSQLPVEKQRTEVARPRIDPVDGHHARKTSIEFGQVQDDTFVQINHRQAYHDLSDPQGGYRLGTQLKFLEGSLELRNDQFKLADLDLLEVNSYNPITPFKTPLSWGFGLGWKQLSIDDSGNFSDSEQHGVLNLSTQFGYSWADADREHLCYAQMQNHIQAGKILEKGWRLGLGPTVGCQNLWSDRVNSLVQIEIPFWEDQQAWQLGLRSSVQYALNSQSAISIHWNYQLQEQHDWHQTSLGFTRYW